MSVTKSSRTIPRPLPRVAQFEKFGFGLFLHWGLYSQLGQGEWIQFQRKIPVKEYARLIERFDASEFDAPAIAKLARDAGMRYAVLTTRHHEGFSLYDTRGLSRYDAIHSPARRDLVAEFALACRAEGITPFFYHTTLDWRWNSARCSTRKFDDYLDYLHDSVEILCREYGPIGGLWFDGNWSRPEADWKEDRLYATIREHQPEAIIVNNTGLHARGAVGHTELDSTTFEQGLPMAPDRRGWPKYLAGEMCETLNGHWGIGNQDFNYKSPAEIIRHLCACRKVGANYLLNVGPTRGGAIPAYEAAVLRKTGEWIERFGNAIYDGRPTDVRCQGQDFLLGTGSKHYYFAYNLSPQGDAHVVTGGGGNGPRTVVGLRTPVHAVRWLDNDEPGKFVQSNDPSIFTLDCNGYDYGTDCVVRIAELT